MNIIKLFFALYGVYFVLMLLLSMIFIVRIMMIDLHNEKNNIYPTSRDKKHQNNCNSVTN
jgi:hypothetical protein